MLLRKDSKHIHNIEAPLEPLLVQIHPFTISPGAAWRWLPAENEKPQLYSWVYRYLDFQLRALGLSNLQQSLKLTLLPLPSTSKQAFLTSLIGQKAEGMHVPPNTQETVPHAPV